MYTTEFHGPKRAQTLVGEDSDTNVAALE